MDNPLSDQPPDAGGGARVSASAGHRRVTNVVVTVSLFVIALLMMTLFPSTSRDNPPPYDTHCNLNLRNIAVALSNYQDSHGQPPPRYTVAADGIPLHSWRVLLLSYLGEPDLYQRIDLTRPWNDPANATIGSQTPSAFLCGAVDLPEGRTTYLVIQGNGHQSVPTIEWNRMSKPGSRWIVVSEVSSSEAVPWMSPEDGGDRFLRSMDRRTEMPHGRHLNVILTDGSVSRLEQNCSLIERQRLLGD